MLAVVFDLITPPLCVAPAGSAGSINTRRIIETFRGAKLTRVHVFLFKDAVTLFSTFWMRDVLASVADD